MLFATENRFVVGKRFAATKRFASAKMLFVVMKRFVTAKIDVRRGKEGTYVSIFFLSQSRLLSHNSQALKLFPNIQQSIYIFRNK